MKLYQSVKNLLKRSGFMRWLVAGSKRCLYAQQRKKEIPRYFRENPNFRALQLGCGGNLLKGWLNADYFGKRKEAIFIDITEAFPFGDDQFDCLMMEHLIEHVAYHDAQKALKECYRVLKPGGVLRIGTPDLKKYVALYSNHEQPQNREASDFIIDNWVRQSFYTAREYGGPETPREPLFVLNDIFMNYEHRFIYDEDCLSRELAKAGFSDVCRVESLKSSHDALRGIDNHADPIYAYLTVTLEATKRTS